MADGKAYRTPSRVDHVGAAPREEPPSRERAFAFLPLNRSPRKPRARGLTEIRGPYYSQVGPTYLRELLDAAGAWVDSFKFAGRSCFLAHAAHDRPDERRG